MRVSLKPSTTPDKLEVNDENDIKTEKQIISRCFWFWKTITGKRKISGCKHRYKNIYDNTNEKHGDISAIRQIVYYGLLNHVIIGFRSDKMLTGDINFSLVSIYDTLCVSIIRQALWQALLETNAFTGPYKI